jgi:superfamily II DNA or RNA helicase
VIIASGGASRTRASGGSNRVFDLPALDTLFLTFPISGRTRVVQYVGRVTRALPGKTSVEVHDYHDSLHPLLRRTHQRRLAALKSIGFVATTSV